MVFKRLKRKLTSILRPEKDLISFKSPLLKKQGIVLFSYLLEPFKLGVKNVHSNRWECFEIAQIFLKLGFDVDVIDWTDKNFIPSKNYDIIFDIHSNLQRFLHLLGPKTLKILHLTGSYPRYHNQVELAKIEEIRSKKRDVSPQRIIIDLKEIERSIKEANFCSLIGNDITLNTYPKSIRGKFTKINVTSPVLKNVKTKDDFLLEEREFLWFYPNGAALRNLDLLLEIFSKNKNLKLNIVGKVEADFLEAYSKELKLPNINYFDFLDIESQEFKNIIKKCFCFIAPSLSEGISSSAVLCLKLGLFPILSLNTGISLPKESGIILKKCVKEDIEKAILSAYKMDKLKLKKQISVCQKFALKEFSQENFSLAMRDFISKAINNFNKKDGLYEL